MVSPITKGCTDESRTGRIPRISAGIDRDELVIFNNALNEVCNGIDVSEFSTRMGSPRDRVLELLAHLKGALDEPYEGHLDS